MEQNNLDQKILTIESDLAHLKELVAINKTMMNTISMDSRSMTTTIQNTILSFGGLREKVEAMSETVNSIAEISEERLDKVMEIHRDKMTDFKCLCESRVSGIYAKIDSVKKEIDIESKNSAAMYANRVVEVDKRLDRIETLITRAFWGVFIVLLVYIINLLVVKLGLPPISP